MRRAIKTGGGGGGGVSANPDVYGLERVDGGFKEPGTAKKGAIPFIASYVCHVVLLDVCKSILYTCTTSPPTPQNFELQWGGGVPYDFAPF